jgi:hypothetical protein
MGVTLMSAVGGGAFIFLSFVIDDFMSLSPGHPA